jgi:hypothetical protein
MVGSRSVAVVLAELAGDTGVGKALALTEPIRRRCRGVENNALGQLAVVGDAVVPFLGLAADIVTAWWRDGNRHLGREEYGKAERNGLHVFVLEICGVLE